MGMTAATLLRALNLNVTIYAKSFPPNTTSNVAGGQWAPSLVKQNNIQQFNRILRRVYTTHQSGGHAFGVSPRQNYTLVRAGNFESCPKDVIPEPQQFQHLPFAHLKSPGFAYSTLLVEPPIFLTRLYGDLLAAQIAMEKREFNDLSEVAEMPENIIVNCTGLGSKQICRDNLVHAVKGQLVLRLKQHATSSVLQNSNVPGAYFRSRSGAKSRTTPALGEAGTIDPTSKASTYALAGSHGSFKTIPASEETTNTQRFEEDSC
jgi:hypothetical protein